MGKTRNSNNLSEKNLIRLYEYLKQFEREIKQFEGKLNFNAPCVAAFQTSNDVELKACFKSKQIIAFQTSKKYYIIFQVTKFKEGKIDDYAFRLLKHLRNSFAHASIKKQKGNFIFTDKNRNNISCRGKIRTDLFFSLIEILLQTKISQS